MIVVAAPGADGCADRLAAALGAARAHAHVRQFPDGECHLRIDGALAGADVVVVAALDRPAERALPLLFVAATARDLGARSIGLVAPYLAYMRQDSRFAPGEGLTSAYFARLVSQHVDWLCTVDPHLHRYASLDAIYPIPTHVVKAAPAIARWIAAAVPRPVLIGPDAESEQWVAAVAAELDAPYCVLTKTRRGDRDVSVTPPELGPYRDRAPVVIDDIISTGRTMIETVRELRALGAAAPICVGVHAVMVDDAHAELLAAGAARVVTCDTIPHPTNAIAVGDLLAAQVRAITTR